MTINPIDALRKIRKVEHTRLHIIDIMDGQIFDYEPIFTSESEAKEVIQKDIEDLIRSTYDYFPGKVELNKGMIVCAFYHKKRKDLIGTIALYHYNYDGLEYIELGLSLIAPKYRKMGFQSVEARRIREFGYYFLRQGKPFYLSARMASATTQLQVSRGTMLNREGKKVNVAYPKGFFPHYIANKNEEGKFILEFGLFCEAWPTLDLILKKEVFFPDLPLVHQFQILQPEHTPDLNPNYLSITEIEVDKFQINTSIYSWKELLPYMRIFGSLKAKATLHDSLSKKFSYSYLSNPDQENLSVLIEKIEESTFLQDFSDKMKSINMYVQISDFLLEQSKFANLVLMEKLINGGFIPTSIFDVYYKEQRIRICLFAKWQNIVMQDYFEFLPMFEPYFKTLWHDAKLQQLDWKPEPEIQIMTPEKIQEFILVERFKSIF